MMCFGHHGRCYAAGADNTFFELGFSSAQGSGTKRMEAGAGIERHATLPRRADIRA
jgi:hypothetical protein